MQSGIYAAIKPDCDADMVIIDGDNYYNCWLLPNVEHDGTTNLEDLPFWRIEKIEKIEIDGKSIFRRMYPNGNTSFQFIVNQHTTYNYEFKK